MTRRSIAALLALACGVAVAAPAQLQPAASEIRFTTRQMGVPVEGRFTRFNARLALDPRSPEAGSATIEIDAASARFGSPELDTELPRPAWLDAARFPQARFESAAIRPAGPGRYEVAGRLTIKGRTRELAVPVQLQRIAGDRTAASGEFTIKRLDFQVGSGDWSDTSLLADAVQVRFKLVFSGLATP